MEAAFLPFISMGWMQENIPLNYTPLFKISLSDCDEKILNDCDEEHIRGERGLSHYGTAGSPRPIVPNN